LRHVLLACLVFASAAAGQARPEARVEFVTADSLHRVEAGAGVTVPMGVYVRGSVTASYDVWHSSGVAAQGRVEGQLRFLLDPIAEHRWGVSAGGGLGYRERAYLVLAFDLEGPRKGNVRPAIQLAFGGGMRAAFVLRGVRRLRR
jgi:hypothetical protein